MANLFKSSARRMAIAGMCMVSMSLPAIAIDFDKEDVVVNGIMYGIVGTEAPYKAYVVEYYDWDEWESFYKGEMVIPSTIEFESGKEATVVGIDKEAFYSSDVTMVTLPNTLESIGSKAFGLCSQLTCIKMGSGITEIGSRAFYPDAKLTTLYIDALTPPTIASDALMTNAASATLFVPAGAVEAYQAAETWNKIGNIKTASDVVSVTEIVVTPATATVAEMGTLTLTATVYPAEAQQKVSWTSSDTSVASVSSTGEVFGKKSGTCVITASATDGSGVKGECKLTVGSGKLLQVNIPFISGFPGEEFKLSAEVSPAETTVEWSIADAEVASLTANGLEAKAVLLKAGNTMITVTASNGLTKEIEVNVKEEVVLTAIDVAPISLECEVGDQISMWEFKVNPVPENASVFDPQFSIEDNTIVDYDPDDYDGESFVCLAPGTTRFVWTQGEIKGYCTISVAPKGGTGIDSLFDSASEGNGKLTVITIDGKVIKNCASKNDLKLLPAGFYIINGKKVIIKR